MKAKPNSTHKTYNLDYDAIEQIEEGSKLNNMSKSEFVEFLAHSWNNVMDPTSKIKQIKKDKAALRIQLRDLELKEEKLIEIMEKKTEWSIKRQRNKPRIITNLMRIISEGRYLDAEQIAKSQSINLGIPAIELLSEATEKINSGQ